MVLFFQKFKAFYLLLGLCFFSALLSACAHPCQYKHTCVKKKKTLVEQMQESGVQIDHIGEAVRLVIPSDRLYYENSANIRPDAERLIAQVATFLKRYQTLLIMIKVYDGGADSDIHSQALTKQQADNLASALWKHEIDTRLLAGKGYGKRHPIASENKINQRVEIIFRFYPNDWDKD